MNANPISDAAAVRPGDGAEPFYFQAGGRRLFGWLRLPAAGAASMGVLVCKSFGYEAVCTHRSLRAFAEAAVAAGAAVLRFDYAGTGDAEDIDPSCEEVEVWVEDIVAAAQELRQRSGVEHVVILGLRLGALLGALASQRCPAVRGLIAVAPVLSGRRYLRELKAFQATGSGVVNPTPRDLALAAQTATDGSLDVNGFALSAATVSRLTQLELVTLPPAINSVLIVDRDDLPEAKAWAERLQGTVDNVDYSALPGYVEMMTTPHETVVPGAMVGAIEVWLRKRQSCWPSDLNRNPRRGVPAPMPMAPYLALGRSGGDASIIERPVFYGHQPLRFGVITEPPADERRRRAVVLLNCGATYHIGPNRMHVTLARSWARSGYLVLRVDLAGLGDSATRDGRVPNEVYPPDALEDIRTAIDFMRQEYGVHEVTLSGVCAGAYHALRAAVASLPVNRILMINPLTFFWKEGMKLNDLQLAEVVRNPSVYYKYRLRSGSSWRRLIMGQVNVWRLLRIFAHRIWLTVETSTRDTARRLRVHLPQDLGWELEAIARRGVRIVFVFADGDTGLDLLKIQAGASIKRLGDRFRLHLVDGADHTFTQRRPRARMQDILSAELFSRPLG